MRHLRQKDQGKELVQRAQTQQSRVAELARKEDLGYQKSRFPSGEVPPAKDEVILSQRAVRKHLLKKAQRGSEVGRDEFEDTLRESYGSGYPQRRRPTREGDRVMRDLPIQRQVEVTRHVHHGLAPQSEPELRAPEG